MSGLPESLLYALSAAAVKRVSRRRKRVAFLIHSAELFSAIEPVVQELKRRPDVFETVFFSLPHNYFGPQPGRFIGLAQTHAFLEAKGLAPVPLAGTSVADLETLVRLCPDFVFRQAPWDPDIPPMFDTQLLAFAHLCYVPYGLMTVDKPVHQYNQPFHNACDFIFSESEYHHAAYAAHRSLGTHGVHNVGYPRFEHFIAELENAAATPWPLAAPDDAPRVIWAPHHTITDHWLLFSTFLHYKELMLAEARKGRISLLLRPHPALRERLEASGLMQGSDFDGYLRAFAEAGCSGVDDQREYIGRFGASDCMITDGIGFFSEYLLTGKPLIRTRRSDSTTLNAFGDWLVEACDTVDDASGLQGVLDAIGTHCYADRHADLRAERQRQLTIIGRGASKRVVDVLEAW